MQQMEKSCWDMAADINVDHSGKIPPLSRAGSLRGGAWGSFVGSFWKKEGGNIWLDDTYPTPSTALRKCSLLGGVRGIVDIVLGIKALVASGGSSNVSTNASNGGGDEVEAEELETDQSMLEFEINVARQPPNKCRRL
jgi:hypothetical protein